jgi:hypothetical protein
MQVPRFLGLWLRGEAEIVADWPTGGQYGSYGLRNRLSPPLFKPGSNHPTSGTAGNMGILENLSGRGNVDGRFGTLFN